MKVFLNTAPKPAKIWHKKGLRYDKCGQERSLMPRVPLGNSGLFRENFIRPCNWKNGVLPSVDAGSGARAGPPEKRGKAYSEHKKFLWMAAMYPWLWTPCCARQVLVAGDRRKGSANPFKRAWKDAEEERRERLPENEQACSWGVWRRMFSFLRGHAAPMDRIFRKIGKNPFHLLSGNFNQDTRATFLFYFLPRSFLRLCRKKCPVSLGGE